MNIPKIINKNGRKYIFLKKYPGHYLYQEVGTGYKESFLEQDLVQRKNEIKIVRDIKPERSKYF